MQYLLMRILAVSLLLLVGCVSTPVPVTESEAETIADNASVQLGSQTGKMLGGSMNLPHTGFPVMAYRFDDIERGQVVAFRSGQHIIFHRVIAKAGDAWVCKGDNNNKTDTTLCTRQNYVGTYIGIIHYDAN
jgi:signal peptidase I